MKKGTAIWIICVVVFQVFFVSWMLSNESKKAERKKAFIKEHQCAVTGFAGKDPERVYTCNNGLFLEEEMGYKLDN